GIRDFHVTGVQTCALPISDGKQSCWNMLLSDERRTGDHRGSINRRSLDHGTPYVYFAVDGWLIEMIGVAERFLVPRNESALLQKIGRASCRDSVKNAGVAA